jgi:hypothetical protein
MFFVIDYNVIEINNIVNASKWQLVQVIRRWEPESPRVAIEELRYGHRVRIGFAKSDHFSRYLC